MAKPEHFQSKICIMAKKILIMENRKTAYILQNICRLELNCPGKQTRPIWGQYLSVIKLIIMFIKVRHNNNNNNNNNNF